MDWANEQFSHSKSSVAEWFPKMVFDKAGLPEVRSKEQDIALYRNCPLPFVSKRVETFNLLYFTMCTCQIMLY